MECPKELLVMWDMVKESLHEDYSDTFCELWYGDITPIIYEVGTRTLIFKTSSAFKTTILIAKHKELLEKKFAEVCGLEVMIEFQGPPEQESIVPKDEPPLVDGAERAMRSKYTFDNFIVGESNKFARAACWKVAQNPSTVWNPLFLYGPSGVGKTHLLYALVNELTAKNPDLRVVYTKGEEFVNYMIDCLSHGTMASFRDRYRECDVLLIDDIQFIAGKISTQEEFFNTFDTLFTDGKQIILASDRPPRDINPLSERLRSRFEQGLLADIGLPNLELRISIIKKKAEDVQLFLPDDVLDYLAVNLRSNIRQLEGSIKKLAAKSLLEGRHITLELAKECVSDLLGDAEPLNVTIDKIFAAIFKKYNVPKEDVVSKKRNKDIVKIRHIAIYLIREITEMSYPNIGKLFDRDHTTAMASYDIIKKSIATDTLFAADIEGLLSDIEG